VIPLALLAMTGLIVAAYKLTNDHNLARIAAGTGLPLQYVQFAAKAAHANGVPLEWVLATIIVESKGNPRARGDAGGKSVGLMQVNVVANAKVLANAGVTSTQMFDPATNIRIGTQLLAGFKQRVLDALVGHAPSLPLDELTRLEYKGPKSIEGAIRSGRNPLTAYPDAPQAVTRWREALATVRAAAGPQTIRVFS
jgi:hypothetical protein